MTVSPLPAEAVEIDRTADQRTDANGRSRIAKAIIRARAHDRSARTTRRVVAALAVAIFATNAAAQEKLTFLTSWYAQAQHGEEEMHR